MSDAKASLEADQELNQKLDLIAERVRLKFH
jgi:predicted transcriptional regulator